MVEDAVALYEEVNCDAVQDDDAAKPASAHPPWIEELALQRGGELMLDSVEQCSGTTGWAALEPDAESSLATGDRVWVLGPVGTRKATVMVDGDAAWVRDAGPLALVLPTKPPSKRAALDDRRLATPTGTAHAVAAWVSLGEPHRYRAAGEVTGTFGDGVDRIVVIEPVVIIPEDTDYEWDWCATEFAIAMRGDEVYGALPLSRSPGRSSYEHCRCGGSEASVSGLETAAVIDIDGDGIDEIAWVYQWDGGALTTGFTITYFADGAFDARSLGSCAYNGCETFLGANNCGRSLVKRIPE